MMLLDSLDSNWKMGLEHFYLLEGGRKGGGSMTSRKSQKDERFPTLTT
jgi:hypothetical protein